MQILNLLGKPLDYLHVDALQRVLHAQVAQGIVPNTLIVWEAQDVYTAGRNTQAKDIPNSDLPVLAMDRGGSVTYHGAGQIIIYPIIRVVSPADVVSFVRATEIALIKALWNLDVDAIQIPGRSGIWIKKVGHIDRKLCAIGIKFAKDTSLHGMALNITTDMRKFANIVPCGLADAGVVSLQELGIKASLNEVAELLFPYLSAAYSQFFHPAATAILEHVAPENYEKILMQPLDYSLFPPKTAIPWQAVMPNATQIQQKDTQNG